MEERETERDIASWGQVNHERRLSLGPWKTQGQCPVVPTVKIRHWRPQAAGEFYPNLFLSDVSISRTNQAEGPLPEGDSETGFIKRTPACTTGEQAAELLGGCLPFLSGQTELRWRIGSSRNVLSSNPETVLIQDLHVFLSLSANSDLLPQIRPRPFPSTSFLIHYSLPVLPCDVS